METMGPSGRRYKERTFQRTKTAAATCVHSTLQPQWERTALGVPPSHNVEQTPWHTTTTRLRLHQWQQGMWIMPVTPSGHVQDSRLQAQSLYMTGFPWSPITLVRRWWRKRRRSAGSLLPHTPCVPAPSPCMGACWPLSGQHVLFVNFRTVQASTCSACQPCGFRDSVPLPCRHWVPACG